MKKQYSYYGSCIIDKYIQFALCYQCAVIIQYMYSIDNKCTCTTLFNIDSSVANLCKKERNEYNKVM